MAIPLDIAASPQTGQANSQQGKGVAAKSGGLLAFLNLLAGQAGDAQTAQGGQDLAAKLAAILKNNPGDQASQISLLQKLLPDASADQLQQALAALQAAPGAGAGAASASDTAKAGLTSDLSASLAADVQEDPDVLSQLQQKFDALIQDGPVTSDKLAQFRKDAVDLLKHKGLDDSDIDQYLASLTTDLGDKQTTTLAAQLGMPVPPPAVAATQTPAPAGDGTDATSAADARQASAAPPAGPQASEDASDAAPGPDFAKQLTQAASAAADATGNMSKQGAQASKADPGFPANANAQPQQNDAPAARAPAPAAAHLSLVNSLAQGDTSFGGNDSSQMYQNDGSQAALSMTQAADSASPQSFVNYLTAATTASATSTAQMVAIQIQRNASAGVDTFTMQLEPAELGGLEVRMKFDRNGGMKAHLVADKPETLALLQQDSAQIHRILQQAGLDMDGSSLSFDLRQQGQQQDANQSSDGAPQSGGRDALAAAGPDAIQANIAIDATGYIRQGGVNIMV